MTKASQMVFRVERFLLSVHPNTAVGIFCFEFYSGSRFCGFIGRVSQTGICQLGRSQVAKFVDKNSSFRLMYSLPAVCGVQVHLDSTIT